MPADDDSDDDEDLSSLKANFTELKSSIATELRRVAEEAGLGSTLKGTVPQFEPKPSMRQPASVVPAPRRIEEALIEGSSLPFPTYHAVHEKCACSAQRKASASHSTHSHFESRSRLLGRVPSRRDPPAPRPSTGTAFASSEIRAEHEATVLLSKPPQNKIAADEAALAAAAVAATVGGRSVTLNAIRPGAMGGRAQLLTAMGHAEAEETCRSNAPTAPVASVGASDRVELSAHERGSISEDAASSDVLFGHLAMRAALDSHRSHYEGATRLSKGAVGGRKLRPVGAGSNRPLPQRQVGGGATRKLGKDLPVQAHDVVVGTAANTRRNTPFEPSSLPGLNHVRATERHVVSVSLAAGTASARDPAGASGGTGSPMAGDEGGEDEASAPGGLQYTLGVGARPKSAQQAWADAAKEQARHEKIIGSVATYSADLYSTTLAELS